MSVEAAVLLCCCADDGYIECNADLDCDPDSITLSFDTSQIYTRRWPSGQEFVSYRSVSVSGTMVRTGQNTWRGTLAGSLIENTQRENAWTFYQGSDFPTDPPCECASNYWGCPDCQCCAVKLDGTDTYSEDYELDASIACVDFGPIVGPRLTLQISRSKPTSWTSSQFQTCHCSWFDYPNPQVAQGEGTFAYPQFTATLNGNRCLIESLREIISREAFNYTREESLTWTHESSGGCVDIFGNTYICSCYVEGEDGSTNPTICGQVVETIIESGTASVG
jgi:hypothetical protein